MGAVCCVVEQGESMVWPDREGAGGSGDTLLNDNTIACQTYDSHVQFLCLRKWERLFALGTSNTSPTVSIPRDIICSSKLLVKRNNIISIRKMSVLCTSGVIHGCTMYWDLKSMHIAESPNWICPQAHTIRFPTWLKTWWKQTPAGQARRVQTEQNFPLLPQTRGTADNQ